MMATSARSQSCDIRTGMHNPRSRGRSRRRISRHSRSIPPSQSPPRSRSRSRSRHATQYNNAQRLNHNPEGISNDQLPSNLIDLSVSDSSSPLRNRHRRHTFRPPPAPLLSPQPTPGLVREDSNVSASLYGSQQVVGGQQRCHHEQHGQIPSASSQQTTAMSTHSNRHHQNQNSNGDTASIQSERDESTHLHLFDSNGNHTHYLISGAFSINDGVVVGHNGATVRRVSGDGDGRGVREGDETHEMMEMEDVHRNHNGSSHDHNEYSANISEYLPIRKVSASEVEGEDQCRVCMEPYRESEEVMTLPCFHQFHTRCITVWFKATLVCPICRHRADCISTIPVPPEFDESENVVIDGNDSNNAEDAMRDFNLEDGMELIEL